MAHGQPAEAKAVEAFLPTTLSYVLRRCAPPPTTLPLPTLAPEALSQSLAPPTVAYIYFVGEGENRRLFRVRGTPPPPPGEAYVPVELHEGRPVTIPYDQRNRWT